jgi:hypothetical protein
MTRANMPAIFPESYLLRAGKVAWLGLFAALPEPTFLHCFLPPPPSLFCPRTGAHTAVQLAARPPRPLPGGPLTGFSSRTREGPTGLPGGHSCGTRPRTSSKLPVGLLSPLGARSAREGAGVLDEVSWQRQLAQIALDGGG